MPSFHHSADGNATTIPGYTIFDRPSALGLAAQILVAPKHWPQKFFAADYDFDVKEGVKDGQQAMPPIVGRRRLLQRLPLQQQLGPRNEGVIRPKKKQNNCEMIFEIILF
jgi:hypothetical protein